ncbi:MAG: hypothetical protein LQ349_005701, partial [Xanthoria aureola]
MSCRKRPISSTSPTDHQQNKRAKLLSDLWQNREDPSSIDSAEDSQGSEFSIRAIIGEKPGQYFIDWADNPVTGESYSPDWQPKRNVSKEAIAAWENQKIVQRSRKTFGKRRRRRSSTLSVTVHCSAIPISKKQKSRRSGKSARKRLDRQASRDFQDHCSVGPIPPAVTVIVSQHSSLDHDRYVLYRSSLFNSASSSLPPQYDSGIGESSPEPQEQRYSQSKVIPDSQPTSTNSTDIASSAVPLETQLVSDTWDLTQSITCSVEIPDSLGSLGSPRLLQNQTNQERSIPATQIVPDSVPSQITHCTHSPRRDILSENPALESQQVESSRPFTKGAGLLNPEFCPEHLLHSTNGCSSHRPQGTTSGDFVIAEDEKGDTSTTQDTSGSVVLTQRDVNSQSQERSVDVEKPYSPTQSPKSRSQASLQRSSEYIPSRAPLNMSGSTHTASALDTSQRSSQIAEHTRIPIGERLKQIRAAGKVAEAPYSLDTDMADAGTPPIADRPPSEAAKSAPAARPDQTEPAKPAPEPAPAKADGSAASTKLYAAVNRQQARQNGFRSEQEPVAVAARQSPTPRLSSTPQPRAHTTPERQSNIQVRPMAVPVGAPLAVRSSPGGQRTVPGRNHLSRHPESTNMAKTILKPLGFDKNEHIVSLAMNMRVRNQYTSIINIYRDAIMKLMESNSQDPGLMDKITELLTRISGVLQHSDLDAEEARDYSSPPSPEDEATWAEQCSFKFCFLRHFLEEIRPHDMHVSIVAQPGRLLDLIEMFLVGRGIVYFRPDGKGSSHPGDQRFAQCRCQVSIVPSGPGGRNFALKPAVLVIAFDGSVSAMEPQVHRMRMQQEHSWLQPIVRLVIYKSAEHLAICLPPKIKQSDRIRRIVSGMTQLRHEAGILQPEDMEVSAAAEEVAIALRLGGHEGRWTLPSVRPLSLEFHDSSRSSSTQEGSQLSQDPEVVFESSTLKRAWDISDSAVSDRNKRPRLSTVDGNAQGQNSINESQRIDDLLKRNAELVTEIENLKSQVSKLNRLATSHKALEAQIATITRQNKTLIAEHSSTQTNHQTHISDLEASLSALQTRYESKDRAHQTLHLQNSDLESSLAAALDKQTAQSAEITSLRAAKTQIATDLERTRKDLLTTPHANPDMTRIAVAESRARDALAANETLTRKIAALTSDLDFTRAAYQSASTSAAELSAQVTTLETDLATATRKASGEAARLAALNRDTAVAEARREMRTLKTMMEERERVCRRKEEEIETLKGRRGRGAVGGGVVTRGGSAQPGG